MLHSHDGCKQQTFRQFHAAQGRPDFVKYGTSFSYARCGARTFYTLQNVELEEEEMEELEILKKFKCVFLLSDSKLQNIYINFSTFYY